MLDIRLIRENPKLVRENLKKRGKNEKDLDEFLRLDEEWRNLKGEVDLLRSRRNKVSQEINEAKKKGENIKSLIEEAKEIPKKLESKESKIKEIEDNRKKTWMNLPNIIDKSVPVGDASKFKVLKTYGKGKKGKEGHAEIMERLGLIDIQKASEIAGARFYYLKDKLVKLNFSLINFALDYLAKKDFKLIQPPFMVKREIMEGATTFDAFQDAIYKIEGEDLYLIGTAEQSLNALHFNELLNSKELPLRYAGISTSFRKEAGAHGKDTKGIFRVHQFEKVEQFVFSRPEDSWKEFDKLLDNTIEIFKKLEIPFRTIVLSSEDATKTAVKTIDLEGWFPSQGYRELGSCSHCTDYQARRSNIKFQDKNKSEFVHTLNNTAIATERMLCCLIENGLQKDGSIKIPKVLWKYTRFKEIKANKDKK